jgi:hypothetical protein
VTTVSAHILGSSDTTHLVDGLRIGRDSILRICDQLFEKSTSVIDMP